MSPQQPAPRRLSLRRHLVLLVIGALVPVVAFAAFVVLLLQRRGYDADQRRLTQSARMLASAIERDMVGTTRTLQAMAQSERLDRGDMRAFYDEAKRIQSTQPTWLAVILFAPNGQQLVNTGRPLGDPLPRAQEPASLLKIVESRAPTVGDLARGYNEGLWAFPVRVPVLRGSELRYVLTAAIIPDALAELVGREPLPNEWARAVVDRRGTIVARSRNPEGIVGQQATAEFIERARASTEGTYRTLTRDGTAVYVAFRRVADVDWTVSVAVPVEVVDSPLRRSILVVAGAGLLVLLVSGAGAFVLSRRVSRGIMSATKAADALAHGEPLFVVESSIEEVAHLADALARSADLLSARRRERDENLARAEAARAEAETANREKDEFLAMLAHELRNPLAPIVAALELLKMRGEGGAREHGIISRQVQHLVRLVDDLLDVSRITRGKIELRRERVELAAVVTKAREMTHPVIEQRGHALTIDVPAAGLELHADPVRLAQVIANLLTNAARYTKPGGNIRVSARREGGSIELSVADDGVGISAELLPRIFDLFVQAPQGLDRQQGGLGIGLTLVRSLVFMHGGRVEARSGGPGEGSTFVVTLPAAEPSAPASDGASRAAPRSGDEGSRSLRVLIVDDNVDAATLLADLFAEHRYEVETAYDGAAALERLGRFTPDVAVLDIGLPVVDGYMLASQIRDKLGERAPIFVAVTGYGQEQDRARSRDAGFDRHFVKPVDPAALLSAIDDLARAREASGSSAA